MAKGIYVGVNSKAQKSKKVYVGVNNIARKIKKGYIGDSNGKAKLFWSGADGTFLITTGSSLQYAKLDRSSLALTLISHSNAYAEYQGVWCNGKWFVIRRVNSMYYLQYSTDLQNWTTVSGTAYSNYGGWLCADAEYVYWRPTGESSAKIEAIKASDLSVITVKAWTQYQVYQNPCVAYDGKILAGYYANQQYYTLVITRSGSTFSDVSINSGGNGRQFIYASSADKTLIPCFSNGAKLGYYKNSSITITQVQFYNNNNAAAGLVFGKNVFSDCTQVSSDGITWNSTPIYPNYSSEQLIGYGDGIFIKGKQASGTNITLCYSEDGINWVDIATFDTGISQSFSQRNLSCSYDTYRGYGDK